MKTLLLALGWFLSAWFVYDISAYALGFPRQATPLIAACVGLGVALALHRATNPERAATQPARFRAPYRRNAV